MMNIEYCTGTIPRQSKQIQLYNLNPQRLQDLISLRDRRQAFLGTRIRPSHSVH
jgi:hypothetical protein